MNKRVIYSYFYSDERRWIVDCLHDEYGWSPVFLLSSEDSRKWADERYPDAVLHDEFAMRQSDFDYSRIGPPVPIDEKIIAALSKYESNYLSWLQDTTGWNFSFHQRRRYYYDVLKYWNTVINNLKPDLFVAHTTPHLPSDYPLYLLCKYFYDIPVLFLNPLPFLDDDNYIIENSMEDLTSLFDAIYLSEINLEISDFVRKYLAHLRSRDAQSPKIVLDHYRLLDTAYRDSHFDFLRLIKMVLQGTAFKKSILGFKKNKKPWEIDASKLTNFEWFLFKADLTRRNKRLKKFYNKIVESPDMNEKYIYFAAPYQPEVPSNLCAGAYEDIFLILDMISQLIPEGWSIYYKEHPSTLEPADRGALMRDEYFYRKVKTYKNVKIIPFDMDTFQLIDNSQAVCTVGGTVGWEAVVRSKPALVFGNLWYQSCKSVFMIKTHDDACEAIKKILDGFTPDQKDVERYAEAIYRVSERNLVTSNDFPQNIAKRGDPKHGMERLAKAFYNAYGAYYERSKK